MWEKIHELELLKEANLSKKKIIKLEDIVPVKEEPDDDDDSDDGDIDDDELNDFRFRAGVR